MNEKPINDQELLQNTNIKLLMFVLANISTTLEGSTNIKLLILLWAAVLYSWHRDKYDSFYPVCWVDNQLNKIQDAFSVYNLVWKFWALVIFEVMYYFDLSDLATFVKIKIYFTYSFIIYVPPNFKKDFQRHKKKWKKTKIETLTGCRKVSKCKRKQCWEKNISIEHKT